MKKPIFFYLHEWIPEPAMTEEEKKQNPSFHACSGYLKTLSDKEAMPRYLKKYLELI